MKYLYLFQITLNNAENATDYIGRLTSALQTELRSLVSQKSQHEREKVENCLAGLPAVGIKLKTVLDQVTCQYNIKMSVIPIKFPRGIIIFV